MLFFTPRRARSEGAAMLHEEQIKVQKSAFHENTMTHKPTLALKVFTGIFSWLE